MLMGEITVRKKSISIKYLPDYAFSRTYLKFFQEKNSLIAFTFHNLFRNEKEISLNIVDPIQRITMDHFRQFVEYYLNHDYTFVSPNDILNGLDNDKKYIMITFDDGHFNNQYVLPILREYKVPAVFFISINNVVNNKCFWWDVLYRERKKEGKSERAISQECKKLKEKTNGQIEKYLEDTFGGEAFKPVSNIDRVFTRSELKDFSKEKYVFLGNHTIDHTILTNCSSNEIESQILSAQNAIYEISSKCKQR